MTRHESSAVLYARHSLEFGFQQIAKGAGYRTAYAYDSLETWSNNVVRILSEPGPTFVALKIVPEIENVPIGQRTPRLGKTKDQAVADLRKELGINN